MARAAKGHFAGELSRTQISTTRSTSDTSGSPYPPFSWVFTHNMVVHLTHPQYGGARLTNRGGVTPLQRLRPATGTKWSRGTEESGSAIIMSQRVTCSARVPTSPQKDPVAQPQASRLATSAIRNTRNMWKSGVGFESRLDSLGRKFEFSVTLSQSTSE